MKRYRDHTNYSPFSDGPARRQLIFHLPWYLSCNVSIFTVCLYSFCSQKRKELFSKKAMLAHAFTTQALPGGGRNALWACHAHRHTGHSPKRSHLTPTTGLRGSFRSPVHREHWYSERGRPLARVTRLCKGWQMHTTKQTCVLG